jgi:hypothetical protein
MYVAKSARASIARAVFLALSVVLASCGGGSTDLVTGTQGGGGSSDGAAPAAPPPTGRLTVSVTGPDGSPLANAKVTIQSEVPAIGVSYGRYNVADTDQLGLATFDPAPEAVNFCVESMIGDYCSGRVVVAAGQSTTYSVTIQPESPATVALFPVTVPAGGVSADRTELDLHVHLVGSAMAPFAGSNFSSYPNWPPFETWSPVVRLGDCSVWLGTDLVWPRPPCGKSSGLPVMQVAFDFSLAGMPSTPLAQGPYSALLLLEQSKRAADYDPYGMRNRAVKHFIQRARSGPQADLIAVAGFAGASSDASWPPLLQQLPLWAPAAAATVFSANRAGQEAAVDTLRPLVGGSAPVFDALRAAMTLTATQTSANGRRAIVALVGGGDDSGLTAPQRLAALASLRQQQVDAGIEVVLISYRLESDSAERENLAGLAAALHAPIIYAGFPRDTGWRADGLYEALDLASDLLSGSALPTLNAVYRMKSDQPGGFRAGSVLHDSVFMESGLCEWDWGCSILPLQFAVEVP